jgi:hypothetical protein
MGAPTSTIGGRGQLRRLSEVQLTHCPEVAGLFLNQTRRRNPLGRQGRQ